MECITGIIHLGTKTAEGNFINNGRTGKWTIWDTAGNVRMVRDYKSAFNFVTINANNRSGIKVDIQPAQQYQSNLSATGVPDYPTVDNKDLNASKLLWRVFYNEDNSLLFDVNLLNNNISKQLESRQIKIYKDHKLKQYFDVDSINNKLAGEANIIIGYRIYEAWNFYKTFQLSDARIIAICPIVMNKQTGVSENIGWLRFADLRRALCNEPVVTLSPEIANLDDVLSKRYFSSSIYKEANIYNREIADYKTGDSAIQSESDRIELDLINMENNLWLSLTEK